MSCIRSFTAGAVLVSALLSGVQAATTVNSTILILAPTDDVESSYSATSGFDAYGIPYNLVQIPSGGAQLPTLNSSTTSGNYGGILILSDVSYDYNGDYQSAITTDQYNTLYAYQTAFNVRMVRLDAYPGDDSGTSAVAAADGSEGCCNNNAEQLITFTNTTGFATANLKTGAGITTQNLWHYPAKITNSKTTWQIAQFAASSDKAYPKTGVAAVINNFSGRQQMVFFINWATEWSRTSNILQHAYIHWITHGLFVGARKVYFNTQIDDMHLTTAIYYPKGNTYRVTPSDLSPYSSWMKSVNSRLPAGSSYQVEIGHNGNGDIINATNIGYSMWPSPCNPVDAIYYASPVESPDEEFIKPLGTGIDMWPTSAVAYNWTIACAKLDNLASWFMVPTNRDVFKHISHTFTHMNLDNSTYHDTAREIFFNQAWLKQVNITQGTFSANGLIPPAITGMHNGDAIKAWIDNGITNVVGDNSRPVLMNPDHVHWPLISNTSENGYAGLNIMPRWPTSIYFDCDTQACTTQEWTDTASGDGSFTDLLAFELDATMRYLFGLRHDPYMFHQANLRTTGVGSYKVGSQTVNSLLQIWVETMIQEFTRISNWPVTTLKHDDTAQTFLDRMARDQCSPQLSYTYSSDGKSITGATVTTNGNTCSVPIPVTFPGTATASGSTTSDKVGSEPLILWAKLSGSPVTFTLGSPVKL